MEKNLGVDLLMNTLAKFFNPATVRQIINRAVEDNPQFTRRQVERVIKVNLQMKISYGLLKSTRQRDYYARQISIVKVNCRNRIQGQGRQPVRHPRGAPSMSSSMRPTRSQANGAPIVPNCGSTRDSRNSENTRNNRNNQNTRNNRNSRSRPKRGKKEI